MNRIDMIKMPLRIIQKPLPDEYPAYGAEYINLARGDGYVLQQMKDSLTKIKELILNLPERKLHHRYAVGKWSIKEILVHIIDDERIYAYRALRYARLDRIELPEFDQDNYVTYSGANERSLKNIFDEYEAVRTSTLAMFNGFPDEALLRSGACIGNTNRRSVRALAYHIAGHELNHIRIIKERYLNIPVAKGIL